ncbi:MAG: helix-turn-helix transcriptional regulator [Pseudomonadota bacterium]
MSGKQLVGMVLKRHPELGKLPDRQLRLVRTALEEIASLSSQQTLSPKETARLFRGFVSDSGKPSAALRAYRYRLGLTQVELSAKCRIPQPHISAMEAGRRTIGLSAAKKLALALGVDFRKMI